MHFCGFSFLHSLLYFVSFPSSALRTLRFRPTLFAYFLLPMPCRLFMGSVFRLCRVIAITFEVVRFIVCTQSATGRGVWGHVPPENFWNLEAMKLLLGHILGPIRCFSEARRQFHMNVYSLHRIALTWFQLSDRSLISQAISFADEA